MPIRPIYQGASLGFLLVILFGCGNKAASDKDIEPRAGEIAGVLVKENGKSEPNSTIQLFSTTSTETVVSVTGIDTDGRFGVFPPDAGTYSIRFSKEGLTTLTIANVVMPSGGLKTLDDVAMTAQR